MKNRAKSTSKCQKQVLTNFTRNKIPEGFE